MLSLLILFLYGNKYFPLLLTTALLISLIHMQSTPHMHIMIFIVFCDGWQQVLFLSGSCCSLIATRFGLCYLYNSIDVFGWSMIDIFVNEKMMETLFLILFSIWWKQGITLDKLNFCKAYFTGMVINGMVILEHR